MNKKTILTAAAVSVLGAGILTASTAFAQTESTATTQDPMNSLVQKIADKFNLNKTEVQAVFDEVHDERHAAMKADMEEKLSQYVTDGKITEAQKQLILQKHKEMQSERKANKDEFKNLSSDERKTQMDAKRTELETWAKENGIDLQYVMPHGGKGVFMIRHGDSGPGGHGQSWSGAAPTATQ